ncbi:MAG: thiolase domain-containing protein [Actinomycetota bacterium]|nr:thiolase domain-containing protein [Actinomycetota bacterium]MDD5665787.1 thiolase domain-containing protein [Actinomycetota bacterium]
MAKNEVAVVGVGLSKHVSKRRDVNIAELVWEAVSACYEDAGLKPKDVDAFATGNMPAFEGVNLPEEWGAGHWGAYNKPLLRITTGGTTGGSVAHGGYYLVGSGLFDTVMCIAFEKQSDGNSTMGLNTVALADAAAQLQLGVDPGFIASFGGGAVGVAVYQASSYMKSSGCTTHHLDKVSALCRNNAALNPYSHLKQPGLTPEEVAKTTLLQYPIRFGHVCPATDGACAMLFTTGEKARKLTDKPAYVLSCASASDEAALVGISGSGTTNVDPCEQESCKIAAARAYEIAGIKDPRNEIDLAEPYSPFAHQLLMFYERLLLCDEGEAPSILDSGSMNLDGELPVCPSGGVISTNAIGASAMERVAECALQIMGKCGERQVKKDVHKAVAHGWGGAVNLNVVAVLSDTPRR